MTGLNLRSMFLSLCLLAGGQAAVASGLDDPFPSTTWAQMRVAYPGQVAAACAAVRARVAALSMSPATRRFGDSMTKAVCECMPTKTDGLLSNLAAQEPDKRVSAERRVAFGASAFEQCRETESSPPPALPSGDEGKIEAIRIGLVGGCLATIVSRELAATNSERRTGELLVDNKCDCFAPEMDRSLRKLVVSSNGQPIGRDAMFIAVRQPTQTCGARMIRGLASLCGVVPDRTLVGIDEPLYCRCLSDGLRNLSDEDLLPESAFTAPGEVARSRPVANALHELEANCRARSAPVNAASSPR